MKDGDNNPKCKFFPNIRMPVRTRTSSEHATLGVCLHSTIQECVSFLLVDAVEALFSMVRNNDRFAVLSESDVFVGTSAQLFTRRVPA